MTSASKAYDDDDTDYDDPNPSSEEGGRHVRRLFTERDDKYLMPPPLTTHIKKAAGPGDGTTPTKETSSPNTSPVKSPPPTSAQSTTSAAAEVLLSGKKLETPLAAMMPSKYEGVNVSEIFPEFRQGKVLRWARLFLPGKSNSLPQIWKNVKRRRRKRKILAEGQAAADAAEEADREKRGWGFQYADDASCFAMGSEDEEEFLSDNLEKPKSDNQRNNVEGRSIISTNPNMWRHGPAELWFDMLNVAEDGENFDYGFQIQNLRSRKEDQDESSSEDEDAGDKENSNLTDAALFPGESFHMLTQRDWETDIVWDGSDAKYKKLTKNTAAGWVPSGVNRTAQNFSQPGAKGAPPTGTATNMTGSGKKGDKEGNKTTTRYLGLGWYNFNKVLICRLSCPSVPFNILEKICLVLK